MATEPPALEMHGISKRFPGVVALDDMDLTVRRGEVHAIVGENGAGKSTLMKILAGAYQGDSGEIRLNGKQVDIREPGDAMKHGVGIVYQDLPLIGSLTVLANVYLARERSTPLGTIDDRALRARYEQLCSDFGIHVDPDLRVRELSLADRQQVEILKVLDREADLIILDEPTAALDRDAKTLLFETIRRLRSQGKSFVLITHFIDEVFRAADRVTVLKDGRHVATLEVARTSPTEVVALMIGHAPNDMYPERMPASPGHVLLEVEGLTSAKEFTDVSFRLHEGEILGLAGLVGSGGRELGHALIGDIPVDSGSISVDGQRMSRWSPQRAMDTGVSLLPGDRKKLGLLLSWELQRNISLSSLKRFSKWSVVIPEKERHNAEAYIEQLRIVTPSAEQQVRNLSGGNQQKVVLARMLSTDARVLILDEPTQGIDVRAKEEIFGLMRTLADQGMAILFSSSEFKEIAGVADRCLVLKDGAIVAEFPRDMITEARLIEAATVSRPEAA